MRTRVQLHPAYVLHTRPWSESSLLVDVFTLGHGRFRVLAKGARRQKTGSRGELLPFQALSISWSGKQLPTLTSVEITQVRPPLRRLALACAFYMNELLFKLLHRDDPHEALFSAYDQAIQALCADANPEAVLRVFECELLREVGFGLMLDTEARNDRPIQALAAYHYYPELGPVLASGALQDSRGGAQSLVVQGDTLLQMAAKELRTPTALRESKALIRVLMARFLDGRQMRSRRVFEKMVEYRNS